MIKNNLEELVAKSKNILLLQGPIGDFFAKLSEFLTAYDKNVFKINFNGGDDFFYPHKKNTYHFQSHFSLLNNYLKEIVKKQQIDTLICFGDNRPCHKIAKAVAKELNIAFWVFEEGYFRSHYVTLEKNGVNAYSSIPKNKEFFLSQPKQELPKVEIISKSFTPMAIKSMLYYHHLRRQTKLYPYYEHHRKISRSYYAKVWIRSLYRKVIYTFSEKSFEKKVTSGQLGEFFIFPLQVHNDSQIKVHSKYKDVAEPLKDVLDSFVQFAPKNVSLVVKHHPHPIERGATNYSNIINKYIKQYPELQNRLYYVHNIPLPIFLRQERAKGMVTVNSTSGLSSLIHSIPVKTLGKANYDFEGLTYQGELDKFWSHTEVVDDELFTAYRNYHLIKTHLNGCFYHRVVLSII